MRSRVTFSLAVCMLAHAFYGRAAAQTPDAGVDAGPTTAIESADQDVDQTGDQASDEAEATRDEVDVAPATAAQTTQGDTQGEPAGNEGVTTAPEDEPDEAVEPDNDEVRTASERVLTTAGSDMPDRFVLWRSEDGDSFIKPVVQIASSLVAYFPESSINDELASSRLSTLLLGRLGFEGQLFKHVTFRSVFERNVGFSLARGGPVGTSIWEGTGSFQARENYIRLSKWGLSLTGGIFPDPASVDYIATASLDLFGMDPYVRDPLLVTGFNQGQGLMLRYNWRWLTAGVSYSAGNPLVSSLSFGFGGSVSALGTLFTVPLRALSNGLPGSDIQMHVVTPSLTFESEYFDIRLATQVYKVDIDITSEDDARLSGYNARATAQGKFLDDMIRVFASFSLRRNQQIALPDVTMLADDYEGLSFGGGAEFNWQALTIGGQYYHLDSRFSDMNETTVQYIVFGVSYALFQPNVAVGLRFSRSMVEQSASDPPLDATTSMILSLRLVI